MSTRDQLAQKIAGLFEVTAPLIVLAGIIGILVISLLLWSWRNYLRRQRQLDEQRATRRTPVEHIDAWQSAADRCGQDHFDPSLGQSLPDDDGSDERWPNADEDEDEDEKDDPNHPPPWDS